MDCLEKISTVIVRSFQKAWDMFGFFYWNCIQLVAVQMINVHCVLYLGDVSNHIAYGFLGTTAATPSKKALGWLDLETVGFPPGIGNKRA